MSEMVKRIEEVLAHHLHGDDLAMEAAARAAIAAIREPTREMLDAAIPDGGHWSDASPETVFVAMIDAALR